MDDVSYSPRYVAFIDILGFGDIVKRLEDPHGDSRRTALRRLLSATRDLGTGQRLWQGEYDPNPLVQAKLRRNRERQGDLLLSHTFSDCTVISAADSTQGLNWLIESTVRVCTNLLYWGMVSRGGIAWGSLHHDDDCVFGKGYIDAYELEKHVAIYPRIAVSDEVRSKAAGTPDEAQRFSSCGGYFRKDTDGVHYLDYVRLGPRRPAVNDGASGWLRNLRNVLLEGLTRWNAVPRVRMKYAWLAAYFNDVVRERQELAVEPIDLSASRADPTRPTEANRTKP